MSDRSVRLERRNSGSQAPYPQSSSSNLAQALREEADQEPPRPLIVSLWTVWTVAVIFAGIATVLAIFNWMGLVSDPLVGIYGFVKALVR